MNEPAIAQHYKTTLPMLVSLHSSTLQRQSTCGQHTVAGSECAECRQKREAAMLQRAFLHPSSLSLHSSEAPPIVHEVLRSPGQPLNPTTRTFMKLRSGHDSIMCGCMAMRGRWMEI
jgi:hypothetical protein